MASRASLIGLPSSFWTCRTVCGIVLSKGLGTNNGVVELALVLVLVRGARVAADVVCIGVPCGAAGRDTKWIILLTLLLAGGAAADGGGGSTAAARTGAPGVVVAVGGVVDDATDGGNRGAMGDFGGIGWSAGCAGVVVVGAGAPNDVFLSSGLIGVVGIPALEVEMGETLGGITAAPQA